MARDSRQPDTKGDVTHVRHDEALRPRTIDDDDAVRRVAPFHTSQRTVAGRLIFDDAGHRESNLAHVLAHERLRFRFFLTGLAGNAHERLQQTSIRRLETIDRVEDALLGAGWRRSHLLLPGTAAIMPTRVTTSLLSSDVPVRLLARMTLYSASSGTLTTTANGPGCVTGTWATHSTSRTRPKLRPPFSIFPWAMTKLSFFSSRRFISTR